MAGENGLPDIRVVDIEEVEQDQDPFRAWTTVLLKVQRGSELLGVRVKIASVSQGIIDRLNEDRPKPPVRLKVLDPQSDEGRALGLRTRGPASVLDAGDPEYQKQLEAFNTRFSREIVGRGVISTLHLAGGAVAKTPEEVYEALTAKDLAAAHLNEILGAILRLTDWTEEERRGFTKLG